MPPSRSRKLLVSTLLAGLITPLSLAAGAAEAGYAPEPSPARDHQALYDRAGLDAETREALEAARAAHHQALAEHRQRLDAILDDDQRAALASARRARHEAHRAAWREARQARLEALFDEWRLDTATRTALDEAQADFREQARALRERDFESREVRRAAWQALRESHREALAAHLDDARLAQLRQAMRPAHRGHGPHHGSPGGGLQGRSHQDG